MGNNKCSQFKDLMMGLMDDELNEDESIKLNNHLIRCSSCRNEYDQLKETSAKLGELTLTEPHDKILDKIWKSPYSKLSRNTGVLLIIAGWLVMMIYGIYEFFILNETDSLPKFAVGVIIIGAIILFITILRDRIKTYKSDPYKEVDR